MIKKIIILWCILLFTTSCNSYTELSDLGITSMLGIDYQNGEFIVYASIIADRENEEDKEETKTYRATGKTLEEAFENIYIQNSKKIYLSHMNLLVITENVMDQQLTTMIKHFLTNNEYRNNFQIVAIKDNLDKLFNQEITAEEINKLITINQKESGTTRSIDFETFLKDILIDHNTILPTIKLEDTVSIEGFTLIKEYKTYETLSNEEAILYNFLSDEIEKTSFHGITVYENETVISTKKNSIEITITSTIDAQPELYQKELKKALLNLLTTYQQKHYDLLKLEHKIYQNNYSYYKKTKDILSKLKFNIEIYPTVKNNYLEKVIIDE